jgi:anti-sigma regulatory factor (Ser/Thr protein kinase)
VNRVDSLVDTLGASEMATLLYLVLDPDAGIVELASAGHPPPLLVGPDGAARYVAGGRSGPLGVGLQGSHRATTEPFAPGALLALDADELVERRGEVIDEGLARLADAVVAGPDDLDALADRVLDELLPGPRADDVALLAIRADAVGARLRVGLPAEPENVSLVRRRLRHWLARHGVPAELAYDVVIAVGEACANAAEHAYGLVPGPLELDASLEEGVLEVVVRDHGSWRENAPDGRGLGLPLMRRTMDAVDVEPLSDGGTEVRMRRRVIDARAHA